MRTWLVIALAACASKAPLARSESPYLRTDWCGAEDPMAAVPFRSVERDGVRIEFLPGTAAERDAAAILDHHIAARDRISRALGVHDTRTLVVKLAPNRSAAKSHGIDAGVSFPPDARIEALYLDGEDTYEHVEYGHEVTHVLAWLMDPTARKHLRMIDEGLAEVFDQSGRDLDRVLANEMLASGKTAAAVTTFDEDDVFGRNYAKAGSFVQTLLAMDADPAKLVRFYARSRWDRDLDARGLTEAIDASLAAVYGTRLDTFRARWMGRITRAAELGPVVVSPADAEQLAALLALRDQALARRDPALLRATMAGFYCDVLTDDERDRRVVTALANTPAGHSTLVRAFATAIKNYPTAALVIDKEVDGRVQRIPAYAEHYPIGWRLLRIRDEVH